MRIAPVAKLSAHTFSHSITTAGLALAPQAGDHLASNADSSRHDLHDRQPYPDAQASPLIDLAISILIPSFILMKLSGEHRLGADGALILALAFPWPGAPSN